jgi:hypothetical protein
MIVMEGILFFTYGIVYIIFLNHDDWFWRSGFNLSYEGIFQFRIVFVNCILVPWFLIAFVIHANQFRRELLPVIAELESEPCWRLFQRTTDPECVSGYGKTRASVRWMHISRSLTQQFGRYRVWCPFKPLTDKVYGQNACSFQALTWLNIAVIWPSKSSARVHTQDDTCVTHS